MLGDAHPTETVIDVSQDDRFEHIGGVAAKLAAVTAVNGYSDRLFHTADRLDIMDISLPFLPFGITLKRG
jgi:hypothetical protein